MILGTFCSCNVEVCFETMWDTERNIVEGLSEFREQSDRTIPADNFSTDLSLAEELLSEELFVVDTIRKHRKDLAMILTTL